MLNSAAHVKETQTYMHTQTFQECTKIGFYRTLEKDRQGWILNGCSILTLKKLGKTAIYICANCKEAFGFANSINL